MEMTVIRRCPGAATFRRDTIGGIPANPKSKNAEILGDLSLISVPSRGANKINKLLLFRHNLNCHPRADN
jgi:hypothetical protein